MKIAAILFFTFAFVLDSSPMTFAAAQCVLPVPDGGNLTPSPPSLSGVIVKVDANQIVMLTSSSTIPVVMLLNEQSEFFTVYGGGVEVKQVQPGLRADIWFKDCHIQKSGLPLVAVMQLDGTRPAASSSNGH